MFHTLIILHNDLGCFRTLEEKLGTYIRIVRLLLEEDDPGQAEFYYSRAAIYMHTTRAEEHQLTFKLCQARMYDYARRFLEASGKYHELSWVADLDEGERSQAL